MDMVCISWLRKKIQWLRNVLNVNKFIDEIGLDKLQEASYCYEIWALDSQDNERVVLAQSQEKMPEGSITVECEIPNYT